MALTTGHAGYDKMCMHIRSYGEAVMEARHAGVSQSALMADINSASKGDKFVKSMLTNTLNRAYEVNMAPVKYGMAAEEACV